ncbi:unnamed protein product [Parnassius apollo]|uniref:(apollo) hypothetical protein n=1 Tax=Parnassius apollo TaxID=110799 RepID=A0A8S3WW61_PARAO|nr:unnamed protein product [Parnassius apollo]
MPQREKNDECEANNNQPLAESHSTPVPLTVNPIFNKTICYKNINLENTTENPIRNTQHQERTCNSSALETPQREKNDECEANNQLLTESQSTSAPSTVNPILSKTICYRNRVLIFSDGHTRIRNMLQNLIGTNFTVTIK